MLASSEFEMMREGEVVKTGGHVLGSERLAALHLERERD